MKLKSLAIITLLVLGCSAAFAQTYSFGFLSASGVNEYCNYETFTVGGRANFYLQGYDVLSACPYSPVPGAAINGFATWAGVSCGSGTPTSRRGRLA